MVSSSPMVSVVQVSKVSPPPEALQNRSLVLSFFDMVWLLRPPVHHVFFYEIPDLTKTEFVKTIIPDLNRSLSTTLQHFFPYAGNLIIFPTPTKKPEIRYVQGDHVNVTYSECNLDFNDLTGNHPRSCDKFYHLIPPLGRCVKLPDHTKIPVYSVQVTLFPNHGISIGMTKHHSVSDASAQLGFLKAWTLISRCGSDELFLARKTFPCYDRVICYPTQEDEILGRANLESLRKQEYQPPHLYGPSVKVRATFIMTASMISQLKKLVLTQLPTISYVSSFTVSCAYIWTCLAKSCKTHELEVFLFFIDCRARMDPPIPATYFGNCIKPCITIATAGSHTENEGFVGIAKLMGENLQKVLNTEGGIVMAKPPSSEVLSKTIIGVAGSPKVNFYDMDFGWGNPKKQEIISLDYGIGSISMGASKESKEDVEIGICLSPTEMQAFVHCFNDGLQVNI